MRLKSSSRPGGVEAGHRLVQHQRARLHGQHPGDGHAPLLPAGKLEGRFFQDVLAEAHLRDRLAHARFDGFFIKAEVARAKAHVLFHGLLKELVFGILEHQPHLAADLDEALALFPHIHAADEYVARLRADEGVQMDDERGFAAAGVADDADKVAVADGEGNVVERARLKGRARHVDMGQAPNFNRHSSTAISSTVMMPARRGTPSSRSCAASCAMGGTSSPILRISSVFFKHLAGRALEGDLARVHHQQASGAQSLVHKMRDPDDGDAIAPVEFLRHGKHLAPPGGVEHGGGFVKDDDLRPHGQHPGDGHALLLAAGEHVRRGLGVFPHAHGFEGIVHAAADVLRRHAEVFKAKGAVLLHHGGDDLVVRVLEDHAASFCALRGCFLPRARRRRRSRSRPFAGC